jgi:hypothetical protein
MFYKPGTPVNFAGAAVSVTQGKIDVALSQFARMYRNNAFVAELLFPRIPVNNQSDKYWIYGRENQALRENTNRAPGSAAERIQQSLSNDNYQATDHSLARLIPDEERANFQASGAGASVEQWATQAIMDKLFLDEEVNAAAMATNTNNYANGYSVTLAGTSQWSDFGNSDPIGDVETAKSKIRQSGNEANLMVLPDAVYQKLRNHPNIVDRFKYVNGGQVTLDQLAQVFGIERVVLAAAVKVNNDDTVSYVWGKDVVIAYAQPNPSPMDTSLGKTFVWAGAPGTVGGFQVEIGRVSPPSAKSDELAEHFYYDQKITSNVSGYVIKSAVA